MITSADCGVTEIELNMMVENDEEEIFDFSGTVQIEKVNAKAEILDFGQIVEQRFTKEVY